jgi:EmrB/QacA subfamily drug resistance transporter
MAKPEFAHRGPAPVNRIDRRLHGVLALSWLAAFTPILDLDIVTTALPRIGSHFGAGASDLAWVVNAYIITFAISILAVGRIGDTIGRRRVLAGGSALFALATAGAALAPDLPVLLTMRALQGVGGSAMLTTSLAVVSASFDGPVRARALGVYFSGGALGGVLGPVVGGMLVAAFGWRMMFAIQIPLAVAVAMLAVAVLHETPRRARSLDLPALVLGTIALLGINVALLRADAWGWLSAQSAVAWGVAIAASIGFLARERVAREPAVRLSTFRNRRFVAASVVGGAAWFSILAISVQVPIYLQQGRGFDPAETGWLLLALGLAAFMAFPRVGTLVPRVGEGRLMLGGLGLTVAMLAMLAVLDGASPVWIIIPVGIVLGGAIAAAIVPSAATAVSEFPPEEAGTASGVFNSVRQLGASLGVAVPAAAYDLASGGRFTGEAVFDGTRAALGLAALVVALGTIATARLLSGNEVKAIAALRAEPQRDAATSA